MNLYKAVAIATLAAVSIGAAHAEPAPWYYWKSKINGKLHCAQTSPGEGWEKDSGPYKDSKCTKKS